MNTFIKSAQHKKGLAIAFYIVLPFGLTAMGFLLYYLIKTISEPFFIISLQIAFLITFPIVVANIILLFLHLRKFNGLVLYLFVQTILFSFLLIVFLNSISFIEKIGPYYNLSIDVINFEKLFISIELISVIFISAIADIILYFVFKTKKIIFSSISLASSFLLLALIFIISKHISDTRYREFRTFSYEKWNSDSLYENSPRRKAMLEDLLNRYDLLSFDEEMVIEHIGTPDAIENRLEDDFAIDKNIGIEEDYKYTLSFFAKDYDLMGFGRTLTRRLLCLDIDIDSRVSSYYTWAGVV